MSFRAKNALVIISFISLCTLFLSVSRLSGFILYGTIIFMMIVFYFLVYWLFNFEVYIQGFVSVLLLPVLLFGGFLIVYYFFFRELNLFLNILIVGGFMIAMYYLILTQNILNASYFSNIGLTQAALVVNNFYSIVTFFVVNLALFLIPEIDLIFKILVSPVFFALIYLAFVWINSIDNIHYSFGVFAYIFISIIFVILYLLNFINPISSLLIVIILAVIFRGITVVSLYSSRKVISIFDLGQIFLEALLVGFFLCLSSV